MSGEKNPTPPAAGGGACPPGGGAPCPDPAKKKVIKITAKVEGTKGVRKPATDTRADDVLTPSTSAVEGLAANAPVVLVRGCHDVQLAVETSPAGEAVQWEVKPNENTESAPTISPEDGGKKAKLKTDKAGSFSVIAKLDDSKVIWNVVFVHVKVDPASSVIVGRNDQFVDGGGGSFASGDFVAGKYAWEGTVNVKVLGGGADKKLGIDKVKLKILQNGVRDTLTGHYDGGGTALEVPKGGLPVVDATGAGSPFITNSVAGTVTPNSGTDRVWWSGDSPAGGFPLAHKNTGTRLKSISGVNGFEIAVASVSDDAANSIVVHAKTAWAADYSGTIDAAGTYTPSGAKVDKEAQFNLISSGTGGQDAGDAGMETFPPRFNGGVDTTFTP
jgi:hypothetical protein